MIRFLLREESTTEQTEATSSAFSINGTRVSFIEASEVKFAVLLKALEVASVCSVVLSSLNKNLINTARHISAE